MTLEMALEMIRFMAKATMTRWRGGDDHDKLFGGRAMTIWSAALEMIRFLAKTAMIV